MVTICVDVMGGDVSPSVVLQGVAEALAADDDLRVLAAGALEAVVPFCDQHARAEALVTTEVIGMDEHSIEAVRRKGDSSIVRGCQAVRDRTALGFFSAGSTGAILAAATLTISRISGVKRPALVNPMPGLSGHKTVFVDLGANVDIRPEMIVQFARMGSAYAKVVLGVSEPSVALLSNGTEETKGSALTRSYYAALKEASCGFVGNCEGNDILLGSYDVIVCDGFTGNVALKAMEGAFKYLLSFFKDAARSSTKVALGAQLLKSAVREAGVHLSGDAYGGAMLMGLEAPVLIGHGATSVEAVKNGILHCACAVRNGLCDKLAQSFV